jgi:uncharacterized protein YcbK (DUF882 family)
MPPKFRYFTAQEVEGLNEEFVALLDQARHRAQTAFVITSGLRTPEKNQSVVGAVADSAHLKGLAVDIRVRTSKEVCLIVEAALHVGITRIGIYIDKNFQPRHLHLDVDPDKPEAVIFVKQEAN